MHEEMNTASEQLASADHLGVASKMKAVADKAIELQDAYHDSDKEGVVQHAVDSIHHAVESIVTNVHANITRLAADLPPYHKHEEKPADHTPEPVKYTPAEDVTKHDAAGPVAEQAAPAASDSQARPVE